MNTMTEDTLVQQTTADYLLRNLHWDDSVYAMDEKLGKEGTLGRESEKELVLSRYLGEALMRLNPGLPVEAYRDAMRQIMDVNLAQSLLAINQEKDKLYKSGVLANYRDDKGERQRKTLRIFDFDTPDNNYFLIVRELWVKGDIYRRRADLVGFVNGIPLLFMEVKNLHKDVKAAYEQNFCDYKDTVPHLFHHNAFVIIGKVWRPSSVRSRLDTSTTTTGSGWRRMNRVLWIWRRCSRGCVARLICSICSRTTRSSMIPAAG